MKNSKSNKQIVSGAILSYFSLAISLLLTFLYTPWMVRTIGDSNYALYTLSTSLISIFILDFGIGSSVARFVAKYRAEGKKDLIAPFLGTVYKMFATIALFLSIALIILYFFIDNIYVGLSNAELAEFKKLYIIVSLYSVLALVFVPLDGILNAYERFVAIKLIGLFQKLFAIALVVIALFLKFGVIAVVSANAISGIIAIIIKLFLVARKKELRPYFKVKDKKIFKNILSFSLWVTVISIAQRCMFNLAPSILGIVSNSTEIAIFSPANSLESYFFLLASAINGLFLPKISKLIAENKKSEIMLLMIKVGRYQMLILGLVFSGFIILGKQFMDLWMGPNYTKAYYAAMLIFIPDLLNFSQQIANTYMVAEGKVKIQAFGYIIMAVVCLAFSFPLSKIFGCIGACVSIALGYLSNYIYINIVYAKIMKLNVKKFYTECYARPVLVIATTIIIGFGFFKIATINSWMTFIIFGMVITMVYVLLSFCFVLNKDEKKLLKDKFSKKGKN